MTDIPILLNVATPLLALVSVAGIVWARRHDHEVRRQAVRLQDRLEIQLRALRTKEKNIRARIGLIVELYRGGNLAKMRELGEACDDLLATVEGLQVELQSEASRLPHLRGRALRDARNRIASMAQHAWDLACDFEQRDQSLKRDLDGMNAAMRSAARASRFTRPVRPTTSARPRSY